MKKLLKLVLVMMMAFTVTACGSKEDSNDKDSGKKVTKISVGVSPDYAPYESLDTNGDIVGFDPDMLKEFEKYLETDTEKYEFEFITMDFDNICTQIQAGQLDLGVSGFTFSEDRVVEWSEPYTATMQVAVVNPNSTIKSAADLKGKKIAAQTSTTGEEAANAVENADVVSLKDVKVMFEGLKANNYDAVIVDLAVAKNYVNEAGFVMIDESLMDEKNYIVAKEGNKELIEKINTCIEKFIASDEYTKLTDQYGLKKLEK